ncbi:MAG: hypothetical protein ACE5EN_09760 [Nitrospinota bacterium]
MMLRHIIRAIVISTFMLSFLPSNVYAIRIASITTSKAVAEPGTIPINVTDKFSPDTAEIHTVLGLENVRAGTKIKADWIGIDVPGTPNLKIGTLELVLKETDEKALFTLTKPDTGWPVGKYRVDIYIDGKLATIVPFSVVGTSASPSAQLSPPSGVAAPRAEGIYKLSGFIAQNPSFPAMNVVVMLYDGKSGELIDSDKTNLFGYYKFTKLASGHYVIRVGEAKSEIFLKNSDAKLNLDLSAQKGNAGTGAWGDNNRGQPGADSARGGNPGGEEYLLQGTLCSWSGSRSSYGNSSSSSTGWASFDGRGGFKYGSSSSFSGDAGLYYGGGGGGVGETGRYRVKGNNIQLFFNDGSSATAYVNIRQDDGRITELKYEGTLYATSLCE